MLDPRKRALEALALGGAVPSTEEVDVDAVPSDLPPTEFPTADLDGRPRPVPQALTTGDPQGATERDYYADALNEKHQRQFQDALMSTGSGILHAFTGGDAPAETVRQRQEYEEEPLVSYMRQQAEADKRRTLDIQQARVHPRGAVLGKPQKSTDPNSPESKRAQMLVKATLGDKFSDEEIAQITEADAENALKYGSLSGQREVSREGQLAAQQRSQADRQQRAQQFAESMGYKWADMAQEERLAWARISEAQEARDAAAAERDRTRNEQRTVPGFDVEPGAAPTPVDAQKMKDTNEAALRMQGNIADLRTLHRKYGEAPKGVGAELQQQKLRAIQIEAKNIAGLGALSGPDFSLMQDLSAQDVNSVSAWVRRNFAGASLEQSLKGLEQWMNTTIAATAKARGYQPKAPAPQRTPAANVLPKDSTGQPTLDVPRPPRRKRDKNGQLWEEQPDGTAKKVPG